MNKRWRSAYNWLINKHPKNWSRSHFKATAKCDILLNNLCESFNGAIVHARDQPIITMLELIRRYIRKRMVARRVMVDKWHHEVGPRVLKIIEKNKQHSVECIAEYCGDLKFEVRTMYHDQFRVDL